MVTTIKMAYTRNRWAIVLLSRTDRNGATYYEVARVSPECKSLAIHHTYDLEKARSLANREWALDKAA